VIGGSLSDSPDAALVINSAEHGLRTTGGPEGVMFHPDQANMAAGSFVSICGAIAWHTHEQQRELLGQRAYGGIIP